MKLLASGMAACAAWAIACGTACAGALTIGQVSSGRFECTYDNRCAIPFDETVSDLGFTDYGSVAGLYTRTITGARDSWAGGKTGYVYRLDLTGVTYGECIHGLVLGVSSLDKVNYTLSGWTDLVVVTSGYLGSIGVAAADYSALTGLLEIYFERYVCPGETTYYIGFSSSSTARTPVVVNLLMAGKVPIVQAKARVP